MQPFFTQVYYLVKLIPSGTVSTYGQIASLLGTKDARRIGHALHANRDPSVPCHRVVSKSGRLAPNFAFNGVPGQKRRLANEGVGFIDDTHVDLDKYIWKPSPKSG